MVTKRNNADERLPAKPLRTSGARKALYSMLDKILALRQKGLTIGEIAKVCDCSPQFIDKRLREYEEVMPLAQWYNDNKAQISDVLQAQILLSIDQEDIKKLNLLQRITAYGILFDKSRIMAGDDVLKIDIRLLHGDLNEIRRKKEEIMGRITSLRESPDPF